MKKPFPHNFLWGTATAAHQVEGGNTNNDFWDWEIKNSIPSSGKACNHYHLYKKDFRIIKNTLHNNSHRLSIEWSRIEPKEGKFSQKEISHYKNVLNELVKLKIEPVVTLHHFTNPKWFTEKGGWRRKENIAFFERFAEKCVKHYGKYVKFWIVINEPNVYAFHAYKNGYFPPSQKSLISFVKSYLNLARAHRNVYLLIHKKIKDVEVSSAINMVDFHANGLLEKIVLPVFRWLVNDSFYFLILRKLDFIALNHYMLYILDFRKGVNVNFIQPVEHNFINKVSDMGWLIYPKGIYNVANRAWKKYGKPILVTENGVADAKDRIRKNYLIDYLTWLKRSLNEGVDIRGYFVWSLMDNIEWGLGEFAKFGLIETDFKTLKRTPRKSALVYAEIAKTNGSNL